MSLPREPKKWTRQAGDQSFLISTDNTVLCIPSINAAFGSDYMYWASSCEESTLRQIMNNSFCFGLYKVQDGSQKQIGLARLITDHFTFAYLTDVYVLPEYQGLGLGGWLIDCVDELMKPLPHLRWIMLRTGSEKSKVSYERRLGMEVLDNGDLVKGGINMGRRGNANLV